MATRLGQQIRNVFRSFRGTALNVPVISKSKRNVTEDVVVRIRGDHGGLVENKRNSLQKARRAIGANNNPLRRQDIFCEPAHMLPRKESPKRVDKVW